MSSASGPTSLGFIGLGRIGVPMVRNLLAAGHAVYVASRSRGPVEMLVAEGAVAARDPADVVAQAEVVMSALPTVAASREVFLGAGGLVAGAPTGRLLIDFSTVSPDLSREIGAAAAARGLEFLDAPVSGGPEGARDGTLAIMVGGSEGAVARAQPILALLGATIVHVGPNGHGSVVKLVNQLLTAVNGAAAAEAIALGQRYGIALETLQPVILSSFGDSRMFRRLLPMIAGRDFSGGAAIDLYVKDIGIVADLATQGGLDLPLAAAALERLRAAQSADLGPSDISALVTLAEPTDIDTA